MAETGERKLALVTGASVGIGRAFACRLAGDGWDVVLVARRRQQLEDVAKEVEGRGARAEVLPADLTRPDDLRTVEERIAREPNLELLVNNAGFGSMGPFAELDADREESEIGLNVLALVRLTRAALPGMIERGRGAVINLSSGAAFSPSPYNATYGATKAFVNSFTESLHEELRGTGVQVQALCPGFTRTEFQERAGIDPGKIPSFAWMSAEDVVNSSLAAIRRGQVVHVPGLGNRALLTITGALPRAWRRRLSGTLARRTFF